MQLFVLFVLLIKICIALIYISIILRYESVTAIRLEDIVLSPKETIYRLLEILNFPRNPLVNDIVSMQSTKRNQGRVLTEKKLEEVKTIAELSTKTTNNMPSYIYLSWL